MNNNCMIKIDPDDVSSICNFFSRVENNDMAGKVPYEFVSQMYHTLTDEDPDPKWDLLDLIYRCRWHVLCYV